MTKIIINGEAVTTLSSTDRAVQYGDGLFETLAVYHRQIECWPQHLARMQRGCLQLGLPIIDAPTWLADIAKLELNDHCVVKLIQSRGSSGRGYVYTDAIQSTRIVSTTNWPEYPQHTAQQGIIMRSCQTPASVNVALAGIKHLNRLDNVLARNEWHDKNIAEGLMYDADGNVIEGTMSNLFAVKSAVLYTPDLQRAGVQGVIRDLIMAIAAGQGVQVEQCAIKVHDLKEMDEIFMTNSIIGIWPVIGLDRYTYTIGKLTQSLQHLLQQDLKTHVTPI